MGGIIKLNFIFINPDEMRADSLGSYGHPLVQTPNFDKLAEEGIRFNQCHTTHTVCSPSRCSFLTGWHPHVRGHRSLWHLLRPDEPNLFKYLSNAGYDIIWYGKNDAFAPETFKEVVTQTLDDVITEEDKEKIKSGYQDSGNPYSKDDPMYYSFLYKEMNGYDETQDYINVRKGIEYICRSTMIRTDSYKLIYRTKDINELYDLKKDPLELNNVYVDSEYKEAKNNLERRMLEWYLNTSDAPEWENLPRGFE